MPDWWALGIIIFQLMNKKHPFVLNKNMEHIAVDDFEFTPEAKKFYTPQSQDFVKKLLIKDQH